MYYCSFRRKVTGQRPILSLYPDEEKMQSRVIWKEKGQKSCIKTWKKSQEGFQKRVHDKKQSSTNSRENGDNL